MGYPESLDVIYATKRVEKLADDLAGNPEAFAGDSLDDLVYLLSRVADAVDALTKSVRPKIERAVLDALKDKGVTEYAIEGGPSVTRRNARNNEVWDNAAVVGLVVNAAIAKLSEGDGPKPHPMNVAIDAIDSVYGITEKKSIIPRTGALRELLGPGWEVDRDEDGSRIDPLDELRQFDGWKPPTIQLTRPKRETQTAKGDKS